MGIPKYFSQFILKHVKHALLRNVPDVSSVSIDFNSLLHTAFSKIYMENILEKGESLIKEGLKLIEEAKNNKKLANLNVVGDELIKQGEMLKNKYNEGLKLIEKGEKLLNKNPYKAEGLIKEGNNIINERQYMRRVGKSDDLLEKLENDYHKQVWALVLKLLENFGDIDVVILAVDGVAPSGKLKQQRQRRFKSAMSNNAEVNFDSNVITPGTKFMQRLSVFIEAQIVKDRNKLPPKVIYSSHLVPNEGENKIFEYFSKGEVKNYKNSHVVVALDADVIQCSLLSPQNNIILYRESEQGADIVSIDILKKHIIQQMQSKTADDFVLLIFLLGNDFLPRNLALEEMSDAIDIMIDIYVKNNFVLTHNGEIDYNQLHLFLIELAKQESDLLSTMAQRDDYYTTPLKEASLYGTFDINIYRNAYYQKVCGAKNVALANKLNISIGVDNDTIKDMVTSYIRMMAWNYLYYTQGTAAINQDCIYEYYYSPMLADLALYSNNILIRGYKAYPGMVLFTPLHQLLSVLPKTSIDVVPQEIKHLFTITSPLYDLFPTKFINDHEGKIMKKIPGKPMIDHGVAIIPLPDRRRIYYSINVEPKEHKDFISIVPRKVNKPTYTNMDRKMNNSPRTDLQCRNPYYQPNQQQQYQPVQSRGQQYQQQYQPVQSRDQQYQYQPVQSNMPQRGTQQYQPVQSRGQQYQQQYQPVQSNMPQRGTQQYQPVQSRGQQYVSSNLSPNVSQRGTQEYQPVQKPRAQQYQPVQSNIPQNRTQQATSLPKMIDIVAIKNYLQTTKTAKGNKSPTKVANTVVEPTEVTEVIKSNPLLQQTMDANWNL
jgi:hypothetical protein